MSTLRDIQDIESEYEVNSFEDEYPRKRGRISKDFDSTCDSEVTFLKIVHRSVHEVIWQIISILYIFISVLCIFY